MSQTRIIDDREVTLIPAGSIREEKEYVKGLRCPECGGEYGIVEQAVLGAEKVDLFTISCRHCGKTQEIYFDIGGFYPQEEAGASGFGVEEGISSGGDWR